ncbi:MAG: septum formation initiator family protein [Clostridia bacterium]|nr:septum formation initiator family protein [Clostridia bacterium]
MKLTRNLFVKLAMLVFSVFCFLTVITLQLENNSMKEKAEALDTQIQEYQSYINDLQATLDAPMDEDYVADIAREELGLRHPQEVVFYSDDSD